MNILVLNAGSSSLKYRLYDLGNDEALAGGVVARIGEAGSSIKHEWREQASVAQRRDEEPVADHRTALQRVFALLRDTGILGEARSLLGIGHRVVHGGDRFQAPARIDGAVVQAIRDTIPLAPLHNPANLTGIEVALALYPNVPQVAVFDTAFHQTMPAHAYRYAVPEAWYREQHVRRYGFHGTSHGYLARAASAYLGRPLSELNLITLHLGNGASATAIAGGLSVDTSMGLTPLEGLMMGTRCGDLDPAIHFYLARVAGLSLERIEHLLTYDSGLKGIAGTNDMREVLQRAGAGDTQAALALDMYCYRLRKYIGAYYAVLGRVDALVFAGGVGENAPRVRAQSCAGLEALGIGIDAERNDRDAESAREIQSHDARVKILVIPTDEEREIAHQTARCLQDRT
jgi:acetate kinase